VGAEGDGRIGIADEAGQDRGGEAGCARLRQRGEGDKQGAGEDMDVPR
jgi:hypothetical protein